MSNLQWSGQWSEGGARDGRSGKNTSSYLPSRRLHVIIIVIIISIKDHHPVAQPGKQASLPEERIGRSSENLACLPQQTGPLIIATKKTDKTNAQVAERQLPEPSHASFLQLNINTRWKKTSLKAHITCKNAVFYNETESNPPVMVWSRWM